jgi:hypothetical protein
MMRKARLKFEFAHLYPGVTPDTWRSAAALAVGPSAGLQPASIATTATSSHGEA